ncbi:DUF4190 domain-containing protein, partial [Dysosmobacter welbionis]
CDLPHRQRPAGGALLPPRPLCRGVERQRLPGLVRPDPSPGGQELWRRRGILLRRAGHGRAGECQGGRPGICPPAQVPRRHPGHRRGVRQGRHRGSAGGLHPPG